MTRDGSPDARRPSTGPNPWASLPADLPPAADHVGPFPHGPFLAAAERAVGTDPDAVRVHRTDAGGAIAVVVEGGAVRLAGPAHLTDYHAPLGTDPGAVARALADFPGHRFVLDSLPRDAADVVTRGLELLGADHRVDEDESTAVLALPGSYDDWLMSIGKKERHEVRRKRRRFEDEFGAIAVERRGADAVAEFCAMHRTSPGAKGAFMTDAMESLFTDLADEAGASVHRLVCDGVVRAAAFGFETEHGYFYYNSAYDPDAAMASPGVVLLSALIEGQIERGVTVFDFLKGDERYKYRHGAERRQLFSIEGVVP